MNLAELRRNYTAGGLLEEHAHADPHKLFLTWMREALECGVAEPTGMAIATATPDGLPSARFVLLKGVDDRGFVFYTNYESRKARELDANPRASLLFYWAEMERQVRISGAVERVSREESEHYFANRPRGSQLGAWASKQSFEVAGREALEQAWADAEQRFAGAGVPCPPFWGGYRVVAGEMEFWQGRPDRMHDRLQYVRSAGAWSISRLSP